MSPMPFHTPAPDGAVGPLHYAWKTEPACGHPVGGDGLFLEKDRQDGNAPFLVVDVMGHGPDAHLGIRFLEQCLGDSQTWNLSPAALLRRLHGMLQPWWAATDQFVAAVALLARAQADDLLSSQAGMPDCWHRPVNWVAWSGVPRGPLLGVPSTEPYNEASLSLQPGEPLLARSDGVTDARNPAGQEFSHGRLAQFLAGLPGTVTPRQVVDGLFQQVSAFVGAGWPVDDTTAVCLYRQP
jgi:serine phosphatase RsbU (regulator of sigma subunit)